MGALTDDGLFLTRPRRRGIPATRRHKLFDVSDQPHAARTSLPRNGSTTTSSVPRPHALGTGAGGPHVAGVHSPYDMPTGQIPRVEEAATESFEAAHRGTDSGDTDAMSSSDTPTTGRTTPAETYTRATIPPATSPPDTTARHSRYEHWGEHRRGTLDLGLLVLRLLLGGTMLYHGLQKLAGWFGGPGLDATREQLLHGGWKHAQTSAALLSAGEVGGGALVVLGLATPLGAGAILAVMIDAWFLKQQQHPGFQYPEVELETVLAVLAAALVLTGPGKWALDRGRGWATRPMWGSLLVLVLAIAAAIGAWWYLHGGNPFH